MNASVLSPTGPVVGTASIELRHDYDELTRLSRWIGGIAEKLGLSERDAFRLELALTEIVTNTLEHGSAENEHNSIQISLQYCRQHLVVSVVDACAPFNPLEAEMPASPASLAEADIGGLGIHLVRNTCDQCRYDRSAEKNVFTMTFRDVIDSGCS